MEQLTKNQAVATSQEAVQNQNEPQLRDENAHNDKSVHGVLNPTYQAGLRRDAVQLEIEAERDRKSGSAGMPRPISYAVFCLKKKHQKEAAGRAGRGLAAGRWKACLGGQGRLMVSGDGGDGSGGGKAGRFARTTGRLDEGRHRG